MTTTTPYAGRQMDGYHPDDCQPGRWILRCHERSGATYTSGDYADETTARRAQYAIIRDEPGTVCWLDHEPPANPALAMVETLRGAILTARYHAVNVGPDAWKALDRALMIAESLDDYLRDTPPQSVTDPSRATEEAHR